MKGNQVKRPVGRRKQKLLYVSIPVWTCILYRTVWNHNRQRPWQCHLLTQSGRGPKQTLLILTKWWQTMVETLTWTREFLWWSRLDMEDFDPEGFDMGSGSAADPTSKITINLNCRATDSVALYFKPDVSQFYRPSLVPYRCRERQN